MAVTVEAGEDVAAAAANRGVGVLIENQLGATDDRRLTGFLPGTFYHLKN